MLYKFKSKATGDLIMLEANGRHVLQIIGKDAGATGIILSAEIPAAVSALEAAIAHEEAALQAAKQAAKDPADADYARPAADPVHLRQRAQPFLQMLKECRSANVDIVWGV